MKLTTANGSQNDLLPVLQGVGFSQHEAAVYLAALELGPASVWDISAKSGIKRPTCYFILDELITRGVASSTKDQKRTIYSVISPKRVVTAARRRLGQLESAVTQLDALASRSAQKPVIRFYEGMAGVREVYLSCLDAPVDSEILYTGSDEITKANYPELLDEYMVLRQERKVPIRVIFEDKPANREIGPDDPKKMRRTRYLPTKNFQPLIETQIVGDRVAYIAHTADAPFAYVIENAAFAAQERQRFELLWEVARG